MPTLTPLKKWLIVLAIAAGLIGAVIVLKAFQIGNLIGFAKKMAADGPPPVPVATAVAEEDEWEDALRFVGTLRSSQGVTLSAEVPGVVASIDVENGSRVEQGQLLLTLDASLEEADLASAQARLRLAQLNLERARELFGKRILAQSEFDSAQAEFDEALALVENLKASIAKKRIRAPFAGRVGIRHVNIGQTVAVGDPFLPLHQSDPMFVDFSVPQTRLQFVTTGQRIRISTDGLDAPIEGQIVAIDPVVDEVTRTARVQGLVRNPEERIKAGQFAEVEVLLPGANRVLRIPASALVVEPFGTSVFVVEDQPEGTRVRQQFVQTGRYKGDFVSILKGLSPGERVVSAGAFKLSPGARVVINDAMQPTPQLNPQPPNS